MTDKLSSAAVAKLVEDTEAAAYLDMIRAAPDSFGLAADESDDYTAFIAPTLDLLLFNRVMRLGLDKPVSRDAVESLASRYRSSGVRNFGFQLPPDVASSSDDLMSECGLEVRDYWTKVYRSRAPEVSVPTDLRVERIDVSRADAFAEVACTGFGMPPALKPLMSAAVGRPGWHHYIAFDDEAPAAVGALFVRGNTGWLGVAATLPAYRRRGAQGAIMARRLRDGTELGCEWFVTETGKDRSDKPNASFHNMMRTGFSVAYHRPNFMPPKA